MSEIFMLSIKQSIQSQFEATFHPDYELDFRNLLLVNVIIIFSYEGLKKTGNDWGLMDWTEDWVLFLVGLKTQALKNQGTAATRPPFVSFFG